MINKYIFLNHSDCIAAEVPHYTFFYFLVTRGPTPFVALMNIVPSKMAEFHVNSAPSTTIPWPNIPEEYELADVIGKLK